MKLVGESFDLIESKTFMKNRASNPLSRKSILHNKNENNKINFFYFCDLKTFMEIRTEPLLTDVAELMSQVYRGWYVSSIT